MPTVPLPPAACAANSRPARSWRTWLALIRQAAAAWIADYAPSMGAALSYYSVFSLAPLLLIVISIAGLVFGQEAVRGEIFGQLQGLLGTEASKAIESVLVSVSNKPAQGIVSTLIGVALMLIGATTVFGELQDALDRIWRAPVRDRSGGLWGLLRARLLSFGMILGIAFLLIVSLVMGAAVAALGKWWSGAFPGWELLAQAINIGLGFVLTTCVFAMIYKIMPRVRVQWRDVWLGAAVTSLLFTAGRFLIGLYIGKSGIASPFGAAGSLIVVFVWVYYSAQIFLIGAEFTWVYAKTFGSMRHLSQEPAVKAGEIPSADGDNQPLILSDSQDATVGRDRRDAIAVAPRLAPPHPVRQKIKGFGAGMATGFAASLVLMQLARRKAAGGGHGRHGGQGGIWRPLEKALSSAGEPRSLPR